MRQFWKAALYASHFLMKTRAIFFPSKELYHLRFGRLICGTEFLSLQLCSLMLVNISFLHRHFDLICLHLWSNDTVSSSDNT
jgi:hypothetical protein